MKASTSQELITAAAAYYGLLTASEGAAAVPAEECADLGDFLQELTQRVDPELAQVLEPAAQALTAAAAHPADDWKDRWPELAARYEALVITLRRRGIAPRGGWTHLKPKNRKRNVFHIFNGTASLVAYEFFFSRHQMLAIGGALLAVLMAIDLVRRFQPDFNQRFLTWAGWLVRPKEAHGAATSTWYTAGLVLGTLVFPKHAIEVGCLVLTFADPAASIAGKRWGRRKLWRDRSLLGTSVFFVVGCAVSLPWLVWKQPQWGMTTVLLVSAACALGGALAELFSHRVDDNFTVPLVAAGVCALFL